MNELSEFNKWGLSSPPADTRCCRVCGETKPLTKEFWFTDARPGRKWRYHACRKCVNIARRESGRKYALQRRSTEEGRVALRESIKKWKTCNPDKVNASHRRRTQRRAEQEGREYKPVHGRQSVAAYYKKARSARIAFRKFIDESSDEEVKCWYAAIGKPWLNPRLTTSEKNKARYQFDYEYHIKRRLYYRDRKTKRRLSIQATNDGTLSPLILKQAAHCLYCGAAFGLAFKATLDHLIPIKKGGTHSAANVVVCCLACNSKKGSLDYLDWIERLSEPYRTKATRAWRKLRGGPPQQQVLI